MFYLNNLGFELFALFYLSIVTTLIITIPTIGICYGFFTQRHYKTITKYKIATNIAYYFGLIIAALLFAILFGTKEPGCSIVVCTGYEWNLLLAAAVFLLGIGGVRLGMFLEDYFNRKKK